MNFKADLATILQTTEKNALVRASKMNLLPVCTRCYGSGRYSFNGTHSICYKCNGAGQQIPNKKEEHDVLILAMEAVEKGDLAKYLKRLDDYKRSKTAREDVMKAWVATGISKMYDWRKASGPNMVQRDRDIADINKKMADAYQKVADLSFQNKIDPSIMADMMDKAFEVIKNAKTELDEYLEKEKNDGKN